MPAILDQRDREKLIKLLGMIGSSADGEALNAARLANRLIQDRKLSWGDVINGHAATSWPGHTQTPWGFSWTPPPPRPPPRPPPEPELRNWRTVARMILLHHVDLINDWELHFLSSISGRAYLTEKQEATLTKIATKCGMAASLYD